jgi:hypothetical protein
MIRERPGLRVLIMSGYVLEPCSPDIGHAFLKKPFAAQDMLDKVGEVLAAAPLQLGEPPTEIRKQAARETESMRRERNAA